MPEFKIQTPDGGSLTINGSGHHRLGLLVEDVNDAEAFVFIDATAAQRLADFFGGFAAAKENPDAQ